MRPFSMCIGSPKRFKRITLLPWFSTVRARLWENWSLGYAFATDDF